jgi:hypothetical protein
MTAPDPIDKGLGKSIDLGRQAFVPTARDA